MPSGFRALEEVENAFGHFKRAEGAYFRTKDDFISLRIFSLRAS